MASNHKLTALIKGRTLSATQNQDDTLALTFDDGSIMTVQTAGGTIAAATGGTVKAVRQKDTDLQLDFENGQTLTLQTAEATSSVMVRDKAGEMEYAD